MSPINRATANSDLTATQISKDGGKKARGAVRKHVRKSLRPNRPKRPAKSNKRGARQGHRTRNSANAGISVRQDFAPIARGYTMSRSRLPSVVREIVDDVVIDVATGITTGYQRQIYGPLNPGNSEFFPTQSLIADRYEKWRWASLTVQYRPSCPTTLGGMVIMSEITDPQNASASASVGQAMARENAVCGVPWEPMSLKLKHHNAQIWYYTAQNRVDLGTADSRLEQPSDFELSTDKIAASTALGTLVIRGVVEYCSPKPPEPLVLSASVVPTVESAAVNVPVVVRVNPKRNVGFFNTSGSAIDPSSSGAALPSSNGAYGWNGWALNGAGLVTTMLSGTADYVGNTASINTWKWGLAYRNRATNGLNIVYGATFSATAGQPYALTDYVIPNGAITNNVDSWQVSLVCVCTTNTGAATITPDTLSLNYARIPASSSVVNLESHPNPLVTSARNGAETKLHQDAVILNMPQDLDKAQEWLDATSGLIYLAPVRQPVPPMSRALDLARQLISASAVPSHFGTIDKPALRVCEPADDVRSISSRSSSLRRH